jgi:transcriptional regulator with XRE-family HTH domain
VPLSGMKGRAMADNSWRDLEEPWDRVKWARQQWFDSAVEAAVALDMKDGTYRCYERGPDSAKYMNLDFRHARRFAQLFKVRWEWLLEGDGEPWLTPPRREEFEETAQPPNMLRIWREFRGLTAAELAKKAGTKTQIINDLENGAVELSRKWMDTLAPALGIKSGFLVDLHPNNVDPDLFNTVAAIPKERRAQVLQILKTFKPYNRPK